MKTSFPLPYLLLITTLILPSCATLRTLKPTPESVYQQVDVGDTIRVHTKDHTRITFEVIEVTPIAIVGTRETIPFTEILKVEKLELPMPWRKRWGEYELFFPLTLVR
jgi:hypothetical protein